MSLASIVNCKFPIAEPCGIPPGSANYVVGSVPRSPQYYSLGLVFPAMPTFPVIPRSGRNERNLPFTAVQKNGGDIPRNGRDEGDMPEQQFPMLPNVIVGFPD